MNDAEQKIALLLDSKLWSYLDNVCDEALSTDPSSSYAIYAKGLLKLKDLRLEEAKSLFLISLEKTPNSILPICGLHLYYYLNGDYQNAKRYIEEAVSKAPGSIDIQTSRAWFYLKENKIDMAEIALEEASLIDPNFEKLLNAKLYYSHESPSIKTPELKALCFEVLKQFPNNLLAHCDLGEIYFTANKLDKAEEHYKTCLKIAPSDMTERLLLAIQSKKNNSPNFSLISWVIKRKLKKLFIPGVKDREKRKINW